MTPLAVLETTKRVSPALPASPAQHVFSITVCGCSAL